MKKRRSFLKQMASAGLVMAGGEFILPDIKDSIHSAHENIKALSLDEQIRDEDFWGIIRQAYTVSPQVINLNNGGVSPQPLVVQEAVERYNRLSNEAPSYYMWRILDKGKEPLRRNMAALAGCDQEEIAFNRNSSEALETIIFGLDLKRGDEVVLAKQDYPNMKNAWIQREARDGIILKWINLELPMEDLGEITSMYLNACTSKTKVVHLTHVINWMGQVLPVAHISKKVKERNPKIDVLVDGAHSFAHLDFNISDLGCDYFGTSLHKWLCAPFGSGMLYVRKNKIKGLYPLFAAPQWDVSDIRKFEHLGTRSFAIEQAIGQALIFHELIGSERKSERLFYLKNYWAEKAVEIPKVKIGTSLHRDFSGALALLQIDGLTPNRVAEKLFKEYKIHSVAINVENIHGVRITPHVYTLKRELDQLVEAIKNIASE